MDVNQCIQDAIRTESKIPNIQTNGAALLSIMNIFVATGNLLDDLKKNIFYNKPINREKWNLQLEELKDNIGYVPDSDNYQKVTDQLQVDPRLFHAIVGIATESTELVEAVIKVLESGEEIDNVNVREEFFDAMWYILIGHDVINKDISETLTMGFDKLKKRYPDKFASESAINRDLVTERQILESYES